MRKWTHSIALVPVAVLALFVAGCASSQGPRTYGSTPAASPAGAPNDLSVLAGTWQGFAVSSGASSPATVTVNPDGSYTSMLGGVTGRGTLRVIDGAIVTTGHLSGSAFGSERRTTAALRQKDGRTVLVGEGYSDRGRFSYELQKTK